MQAAFAAARRHFGYAALFSALLNLLFIAPMLYMLQVYDRVVPTGGVVTLVILTLVLGAAIATIGVLEALRSRLMVKVSLRLDQRVSRAILARLKHGPATVGDLGRPFDMTGPAVSKHLRVLEKAGLVSRSRIAQSRPATLEPAPLEQVSEWAEEFRQFWDERFDRLDDYLATMTDPDLPTEDDA